MGDVAFGLLFFGVNDLALDIASSVHVNYSLSVNGYLRFPFFVSVSHENSCDYAAIKKATPRGVAVASLGCSVRC
jgi:hypothetical protein